VDNDEEETRIQARNHVDNDEEETSHIINVGELLL
jgi:hypothetical protein